MIKANELRIGNWIYSTGLHEYKKVRGVMLTESDETLSILYKPIPLTEDMLVKCGFECFEFDNGQPNQYRFKSRLIVIRDNVFVDYGSDVKIYHLHTLQNLIFAITGEELNIIL